jgi:hypothetical protein
MLGNKATPRHDQTLGWQIVASDMDCWPPSVGCLRVKGGIPCTLTYYGTCDALQQTQPQKGVHGFYAVKLRSREAYVPEVKKIVFSHHALILAQGQQAKNSVSRSISIVWLGISGEWIVAVIAMRPAL